MSARSRFSSDLSCRSPFSAPLRRARCLQLGEKTKREDPNLPRLHHRSPQTGFKVIKPRKSTNKLTLMGRSPRSITKSDQALKVLQKKFRLAIYRYKELVQAFLRPYRAGRILHAFPGASPQAFVFRPFQGVGVLLLCFVSIIFACSPCAAQSASSTDPASQPAQPAPTAQPAQGVNAVQPTQTTQPAASPSPTPSPFTRSQNVTINLINRLVQRGVLTKEDAAELIKMAEEDTAAARAEAAQAAQASQAAQAVPLPTASPESATARELATSPQLL